ncbi:16S rRNA (cytidine(1402)-2'-O)-methyltransferase [Borrelia sp. RT5S]|uniref:16S rRNA (cytidine(1402)-2'-O)-methyltransferase n=1 Tax=Borrelia sp. RT5S TaxID=2898581 RepID=UPI001E347574|nr:16S rRNA (cytidine(1402)-2'-O)-methyltransferase [Borrelia sp. RT5S]UGQ16109.1 16S rRNA (cytidine(1402)-2'-O)-methyltransferase [Borrelia sp. RT5S]
MFYVVGTPIGNLGDITYRAVDVLKLVDVIFAEDTRITRRLLARYGIVKKLVSCNAATEDKKIKLLLEYLSNEKSVAFVSDAGTPCLSDPGGVLIDAALKNGHKVCPIPGVSSFNAIISVNPFRDKVIVFEGFLSNKGVKRIKRIEELYGRGDAFVILESSHRILKLLFELSLVDLEANVLVGREMTKVHEEYRVGKPLELRKYFEGNKKVKGEFTVLVSRKSKN